MNPAVDPHLIVTASPHVRSQDSTPVIMWNVVAALAPVVLAAAWFFGISALLVIVAATIGAVITERIFGRGGTLADGSAAITGVLLGLTLPAGLPLWRSLPVRPSGTARPGGSSGPARAPAGRRPAG